MTFKDLLAEKEMTVYRLSALSGLPKTTLTDISSGKTDISDCSGRTLKNVAAALNMTVDDLLLLEKEEPQSIFPSFLNESIADYRKALRKKSPMLDCYLDQLNSSINVAEVENLISKEQASRLRKRYFA